MIATTQRLSVTRSARDADPLRDTQPLTPANCTPGDPARHFSPRVLFSSNQQRILPAYLLLVLENVFRLAQPLLLGWAINDLLVRSYHGLMIFVAQHLTYLVVTRLRQMHETRVFSDVSANATTQILTDDALRSDEPRLARRLSEVRESVGYWEHFVPLTIHTAFTLAGALLLLGWYDITLVPLCLALLVPAALLNAAYGRTSSLLGSRLLAEHEREANVLAAGESRDIRRHFEALTRWRIKLTDTEASKFCLMELFILGVMGTALVHYCLNMAPQAGDLFAVIQYLLLFAAGLGSLPLAAPRLAKPSASHQRPA